MLQKKKNMGGMYYLKRVANPHLTDKRANKPVAIALQPRGLADVVASPCLYGKWRATFHQHGGETGPNLPSLTLFCFFAGVKLPPPCLYGFD